MLSNQLKRDWAEDIIVGAINLQTVFKALKSAHAAQ